jgi:hypothetical protein
LLACIDGTVKNDNSSNEKPKSEYTRILLGLNVFSIAGLFIQNGFILIVLILSPLPQITF